MAQGDRVRRRVGGLALACCNQADTPGAVIAGLVPAIPINKARRPYTGMAGTIPAMTYMSERILKA
jgi:hypothetical protein